MKPGTSDIGYLARLGSVDALCRGLSQLVLCRAAGMDPEMAVPIYTVITESSLGGYRFWPDAVCLYLDGSAGFLP